MQVHFKVLVVERLKRGAVREMWFSPSTPDFGVCLYI